MNYKLKSTLNKPLKSSFFVENNKISLLDVVFDFTIEYNKCFDIPQILSLFEYCNNSNIQELRDYFLSELRRVFKYADITVSDKLSLRVCLDQDFDLDLLGDVSVYANYFVIMENSTFKEFHLDKISPYVQTLHFLECNNLERFSLFSDNFHLTDLVFGSLWSLDYIYNLDRIVNLEFLRIFECNYLLEISVFPDSLRYISISNCKDLHLLPSFPDSLEEIEIYNCNSLVNFPNLPKNLKSLSVTKCPNLSESSLEMISNFKI